MDDTLISDDKKYFLSYSGVMIMMELICIQYGDIIKISLNILEHSAQRLVSG